MYNVLSLFDGISCGQVALHRAGIPINKYYASEIDQRAVKVTQRNWPKTIQFGDVTKIRKEHFMSPIDILIGGSPCQGFSFAGKQLNFEDPRSKLFFEFVRLRDELQPKYFFLENVRMVKESEKVITEYMGVEPIYFDSKNVSAGNRYRIYWTNIPGFVAPKDKGILLKHILEKDSQGYVHDFRKGIHRYKPVEKAVCLGASYYKGIDNHQARTCIKIDGTEKYRMMTVVECCRQMGLPDNYCDSISRSAAYHALGNGWEVNTIVEFFKNIPK